LLERNVYMRARKEPKNAEGRERGERREEGERKVR
jgi:hypothetical protein